MIRLQFYNNLLNDITYCYFKEDYAIFTIKHDILHDIPTNIMLDIDYQCLIQKSYRGDIIFYHHLND